MTTPYPGDITRLLQDVSGNKRGAMDELLPLVYDELRALAHRQHLRFSDLKTLNTTAILHEAYLKLVDHDQIDWKGRSHFFCVAARAMRQILLDYVRARNSQKRGGGQVHLSLEEDLLISDEEGDELMALDEALKILEKLNPRQSQIVECRFFGGMTIDETASVLDVSSATVKRDWNVAQAWLYRELRRDISA